jgi:hypothetical protein
LCKLLADVKSFGETRKMYNYVGSSVFFIFLFCCSSFVWVTISVLFSQIFRIDIPLIICEELISLTYDGGTVLDPHCFLSEKQGNHQWKNIQYVNESNKDVIISIATLHQHCLTNSGCTLEIGNLVNNCRRDAEDYIVCVCVLILLVQVLKKCL